MLNTRIYKDVFIPFVDISERNFRITCEINNLFGNDLPFEILDPMYDSNEIAEFVMNIHDVGRPIQVVPVLQNGLYTTYDLLSIRNKISFINHEISNLKTITLNIFRDALLRSKGEVGHLDSCTSSIPLEDTNDLFCPFCKETLYNDLEQRELDRFNRKIELLENEISFIRIKEKKIKNNLNSKKPDIITYYLGGWC